MTAGCRVAQTAVSDAVDPSFRALGALAILVALRTFLSTELELEIAGRWPWQPRDGTADEAAAGEAAEPAPTRRG